MVLPPEAAATAEGANGDGSMPAAELEAALRSLPRGKAPGMDGIPYEFLSSTACSRELSGPKVYWNMDTGKPVYAGVKIHETRAGVMAKGHQQSMVTQRVACLKAQAAW
ncbi:g5276 [Coccomyxa elongata]